MTTEAAIANLQTKLFALSGMKAAPDYPPEGSGAFPFAISYERSGTLATHSAYFADDLVTIFSEIHVSRAILPKAIQTAMAFRDPFLKALIADPSLGGSVSTIINIRRTFGTLSCAGVETLGYRFEIDVKVQISV